MEDELIAGLTRQVKEEVVENYLTERRLLEIQVEEVHRHAKEVRFKALKTAKRLNRLWLLMVKGDTQQQLFRTLGIPRETYWSDCFTSSFSRKLGYIRVRALTGKGRFRKLLLESYSRFHQWMQRYNQSYHELQKEVEAVNHNIDVFQKNFDLLSILRFLKTLDTQTLERKRYLGENFTADEMASVEKRLYIKPVKFESFSLPIPIPVHPPKEIESNLTELADTVYRKYQAQVKAIMQ